MPNKKPEDIVRDALNKLWNGGQTTAIDELYDSDVRINVPGATFRGRDGIQRFMGMYHDAFPDMHVENLGFYPHQRDEGGVLHWRFTGTHQGRLMGIEPTNNRVSIEGFTESRMKDGRIIEENFLWDRVDQMNQLGVSLEDLK